MRSKFLLLLVMGFVACKNRELPPPPNAIIVSIDAKKQKAQKDESALSGYDYILLETKDDNYTGMIDKVEIEGDKLFVLSSAISAGSGEVFIFDTQGKFIKKLQKGRGPKEYIYPLDITLDRVNRKLAVLDNSNRILEYDLDGNFLGIQNVDVDNVYIQSAGKGYLLYNPSLSKANKALVSYLPDNGDVRGLLDRVYDGEPVTVPGYSFTPAGKDSVLVANIFSDTVYLFNGVAESLSPYIIFDHGPKGSANENVSRFKTLRDYRTYARENNKGTGPSPFSKIGEYLFFINYANYYGVHNLSEGTTRLYENLFPNMRNWYGLAGKTEDRLIFAYDPLRVLEYFEKNPPVTEKDRELAARLKQDDNPVLILGYIEQ